MSKQILINSNPQETRIALLEDDRVMELFFERHSSKGIVGNIYKGKVVRVLPGMQAAFVDIGHERAAFLYAGDFYKSRHNTDDLDDDEEDHHGRGGRRNSRGRRNRNYDDVPPIAELVKEGQEILVQVAKGPIGTKGARVTCHISLPGRFVVFMPTLTHNGVSRKIDSYDHRKRLKKIIDQHRVQEGGFIVRTAAGADKIFEKQIKNDVDYLKSLWTKINRKFNQNAAPKLLHYDLDLTTRMIRDHLDDDIEYMILDSKIEHRKVLRFIRNFNPELKNKIELYQDPIPLFDRFGVEQEINRALGKRVWLKSGGYLIIENTEALTSIDVNTGRFVGKKNLEETIVKTNMEAAEELVRQLRLRNIGGIIIVDFIDMERDHSKEQVYRYLESLVRDDKQKTTVLKISNLGLVEMTRKRARTPLHRQLTESCPNCDGRGFVKSAITVAHQTLRDIRRELPFCEEDHLYVVVHPEVYEALMTQEKQTIVALEKKFQKGIRIEKKEDFHMEQIGITPSNSPKMTGAKLAPLPFMQKVELPEDYAQDQDDLYNDSKEYEADIAEIQTHREDHLKRLQKAAELARQTSKNPETSTEPDSNDVQALEYSEESSESPLHETHEFEEDGEEDIDVPTSDLPPLESPVIRNSENLNEAQDIDEEDEDDEDFEEDTETEAVVEEDNKLSEPSR